ncbi:MAG: cobalamin-dependent protein [Aigarchaeota archaeon]|nr:cobalamin-dependent protein [Candidatus Pelearchaeum maunauluense]
MTWRRPRVLLAKLGVDIHDVGIRMVARYLRDNGVEIIFLGYALPETIVRVAIDEDVDVIGISSMQGMHHVRVPEVLELLKREGADIPVIVGGIIPPNEAEWLKQLGVKEVFPPGSQLSRILSTIRSLA